MTIRKPLVLISGVISQLPSTDSIALPEGINYQADATALAGQAVYPSAAGHVNLAKADSATTCNVSGLAAAGITSGASGPIQNGGVITLTTAQWDAVAGTSGGLIFGTKYYLSDTTAGMLVATPPSTGGHFQVPVGIANSTTDMLLYNDGFPIAL